MQHLREVMQDSCHSACVQMLEEVALKMASVVPILPCILLRLTPREPLQFTQLLVHYACGVQHLCSQPRAEVVVSEPPHLGNHALYVPALHCLHSVSNVGGHVVWFGLQDVVLKCYTVNVNAQQWHHHFRNPLWGPLFANDLLCEEVGMELRCIQLRRVELVHLNDKVRQRVELVVWEVQRTKYLYILVKALPNEDEDGKEYQWH
mmetsp:Transcript_25417/g.58524  ORF Transcript_25417/g.58524 Transcript_25417/m.58524 type:complete len:205 (-) Transcript_25417:109-723(-)